MRLLSIFSFIILLSIVSCREPEQQKNYIAKVGNSYLTVKDVEEYLGSVFDTTDSKIQLYVNKWIEKELLYQEALKKGYADSNNLEKQITDIRKQLIVENYLENEIYKEKNQFVENDLKTYYNQHSQEFLLREDAVKINLALFNDRQYANDFRSLLLKGKNWPDAVLYFNQNPDKLASIQSNLLSVVYTQITLYPPELWKVIQNLQKNNVSFPVKSGDLFYVIQLLEKTPKHTIANYETVEDEVKSRFLIQKRCEKYGKLLDNLRKGYNVQVDLKSLEKEKNNKLEN